MSGPSPAQSKKNIFRKICDFPAYFLLNFGSYQLEFLYRKNTNPVLKYLVFVKTLKKYLCFHAYGQVSKSIKKNHIVFSYNKENFKKKYFSMHFGFNNQFIKITRTWPLFQKNPKQLFSSLLISGITNLYVKRIPDIKKIVLLFMLGWLGFTR
jgi:hypothetical protein